MNKKYLAKPQSLKPPSFTPLSQLLQPPPNCLSLCLFYIFYDVHTASLFFLFSIFKFVSETSIIIFIKTSFLSNFVIHLFYEQLDYRDV